MTSSLPSFLYGLLADLVVVAHLGFVVFVVAGGLLVLRWPRVARVHLPCAAWGALIELAGWVCPLTPLENLLRRAAQTPGYERGFVEHYVIPIVYPGALTDELRVALGLLVIAVNGAVYGVVWRHWRVRQASHHSDDDGG